MIALSSIADRIDSLDVDNYGATDDGPSGDAKAAEGSIRDSTGDDAPTVDGAGDAVGDTGTDPDGDSKDGGGATDDSPTDEGFAADELDDGAGETPPADEPVPAPASNNLSPELKYIVDNLPDLAARGKDGKVYQVKAAGQLPDDFEFATKKDELVFSQALAAQELKAQNLQGQYQREQQTKQTQAYNAQENADIRTDMADLQREGALPKFKYQPTDKRFEADPAVKQAQEVLAYMNERNQAYTKAGKLYRISYRDAFDQVQRKADAAAKPDAQAQEDKDRQKVTRQLAGSSTAPSAGLSKPRPARSMNELLARIDGLED